MVLGHVNRTAWGTKLLHGSLGVTKDKPDFKLQSFAFLLSGKKSCVSIFYIMHIQ